MNDWKLNIVCGKGKKFKERKISIETRYWKASRHLVSLEEVVILISMNAALYYVALETGIDCNRIFIIYWDCLMWKCVVCDTKFYLSLFNYHLFSIRLILYFVSLNLLGIVAVFFEPDIQFNSEYKLNEYNKYRQYLQNSTQSYKRESFFTLKWGICNEPRPKRTEQHATNK